MNLQLTDLLTPSQIEQAEAEAERRCGDLDQQEMLEMQAIQERYAALRAGINREVLLSFLVPLVSPVAPTKAHDCYTSRELAEVMGVHKDTVNNWRRAGLLPDPQEGTGTSPTNPAVYLISDIEALREQIEARQEAAKISNTARLVNAKETTPAAKKPEALLTSPPEGYLTSQGLAEASGIGRSTVSQHKANGLIKPAGQYFYNNQPADYWDQAAVEALKAYQAGKQVGAKDTKSYATAPIVTIPPMPEIPAPTYQVNEQELYEAIELGKHRYSARGTFWLQQRIAAGKALHRPVIDPSQDAGEWETIECWGRTGLGRWESTPATPGIVGTHNGTSTGPLVAITPGGN